MVLVWSVAPLLNLRNFFHLTVQTASKLAVKEPCHICAQQLCTQGAFDKHLEYIHGNGSSLCEGCEKMFHLRVMFMIYRTVKSWSLP